MSKETKETEYFRNRLEHTVGFTHEATKNIYLVNGAVLAIAAFVASDTLKIDGRLKLNGLVILLIMLGIVNLFHALILLYQGYWYRILDLGYAKYSGIFKRPDISSLVSPRWLSKAKLGTHRSYFLMHLVISLSLFLTAFYLYLYLDSIGVSMQAKPEARSSNPLRKVETKGRPN